MRVKKMALQKSKTLNNGVTINYWHIKKYEHLVKNGSPYIKFYLCGYVSEEAKNNGYDYLDVYEFNYCGDCYVDLFSLGTLSRDDIYVNAYAKIKESSMVTEIDDITGNETQVESNFFIDAIDLI